MCGRFVSLFLKLKLKRVARDLIELGNKNKYSKGTIKFIALYLVQLKLSPLKHGGEIYTCSI